MVVNEQEFNDMITKAFEFVFIPLLLILSVWMVVSYHKLAKEAGPYLRKGKRHESTIR
jgi:hypothetical protein